MNAHRAAAPSRNWPLILIACALAGAGVSYHFTLESRFMTIEQKLEQNSAALQQYQDSQDAIASSRSATLDSLSKEVETLQASIGPLGKATREQTDTLAELRAQIEALKQAQAAQNEAQKKLAGSYADQLEKLRHKVRAETTAPAATPAPTAAATPAPVPQTAPAAVSVPTTFVAPAVTRHLPFPPHADVTTAVDLRPIQTTPAPAPAPSNTFASVRALPVALSAADMQ